MMKYVHVPHYLSGNDVVIESIDVTQGQRIRRGTALCHLEQEGVMTPVVAQQDGWVRQIAVKSAQRVQVGELLLIVDVTEVNDFSADADELGPHTELGEQGRRALEREGQKAFGKAVKALFEAHEQSGGMGQSPLREHPYTSEMKEGVPPKMSSDAPNNQDAVKEFVEDATNSPELRKQLDHQLQKQFDAQPTYSTAPTLTKQ